MTKIKGFRLTSLDQALLKEMAEKQEATMTRIVTDALWNYYINFKQVYGFRELEELTKECFKILENHSRHDE